MTIYKSSSATKQITILELEYATKTTISAPSSASQGTPFPISGRLTFREGGIDYGLGGRTIGLSYNGISLGITTTDGSGNYSKSVSIGTDGSFTLKAAFAGSAGLAASSATTGVQIGVIAPATLVIAALAAYLLLRR